MKTGGYDLSVVKLRVPKVAGVVGGDDEANSRLVPEQNFLGVRDLHSGEKSPRWRSLCLYELGGLMRTKRKQVVCVSLDASTLDRVDGVAKELSVTRSSIVEKALEGWLQRLAMPAPAVEEAHV